MGCLERPKTRKIGTRLSEEVWYTADKIPPTSRRAVLAWSVIFIFKHVSGYFYFCMLTLLCKLVMWFINVSYNSWEFWCFCFLVPLSLTVKSVTGNNRTQEGIISIGHFTVVCLVPWPLGESEVRADFVLIETFLLFTCKSLWTKTS